MTKKCGDCGLEKLIEEFSRKGAGWQHSCKACRRKYSKNHYQRNREYYSSRNKVRKDEWRAWWVEYRRTLKCSMCPETHIACLDFHHRDPRKKEGNLSVVAGSGAWSKERILKEVAKCDVVCSNCHRKLHYSGVV